MTKPAIKRTFNLKIILIYPETAKALDKWLPFLIACICLLITYAVPCHLLA